MKMSELKKRGMELKPTVMIGRSGFTDSIKDEIIDQLDGKELVKIKFQRSMGPRSAWKDLLQKKVGSMDAQLIEIKGNTAIVYKPSRS